MASITRQTILFLHSCRLDILLDCTETMHLCFRECKIFDGSFGCIWLISLCVCVEGAAAAMVEPTPSPWLLQWSGSLAASMMPYCIDPLSPRLFLPWLNNVKLNALSISAASNRLQSGKVRHMQPWRNLAKSSSPGHPVFAEQRCKTQWD